MLEINIRRLLNGNPLPELYADVDSVIGLVVRQSYCPKCNDYIFDPMYPVVYPIEESISTIHERQTIFSIMGLKKSLREFYYCSICKTRRTIYPVSGKVEEDSYTFHQGYSLSKITRRDPQAATRYNLPFPQLKDLN